MVLPLNPWIALPAKTPFVLDCDALAIEVFNRNASSGYKIHDSLIPEPFFGSFRAPVVVVLLNPGVNDRDARAHRRSGLREQLLENLRRTRVDLPHVHLDSAYRYPGAEWWRRAVAQCNSDKVIARSLLGVQYFPYHSRAFAHSAFRLRPRSLGLRCPCGDFPRRRDNTGARARLLVWSNSPPCELSHRLFSIKNKRRFTLSQGNIADDGFEKICDALGIADA